MNVLAGYKTYITAGLVGIVTALEYAGIITPEQTQAAYGVLAAFGLYALRQGVSNG